MKKGAGNGFGNCCRLRVLCNSAFGHFCLRVSVVFGSKLLKDLTNKLCVMQVHFRNSYVMVVYRCYQITLIVVQLIV